MITKRVLLVLVGACLLVAGSAFAAKGKLYENKDLGVRMTLKNGVKVTVSDGGSDRVIEATQGKIKVKVVVRKGEKLPAAQHHFRLMSYFAGEWQMAEDDCRGIGWNECSPWNWDAEGGDRKGLGMVGYGPGGTYIVVVHGPAKSFKSVRPSMRAIQESIELF